VTKVEAEAADLQAARDEVWQALASRPLRRSILGRERCDAIVRVAMHQLQAVDVEVAAGWHRDGEMVTAVRRRVERRVKSAYAEQCGMAFTTLILVWAISAIVQALVIRWLSNRSGS